MTHRKQQLLITLIFMGFLEGRAWSARPFIESIKSPLLEGLIPSLPLKDYYPESFLEEMSLWEEIKNDKSFNNQEREELKTYVAKDFILKLISNPRVYTVQTGNAVKNGTTTYKAYRREDWFQGSGFECDTPVLLKKNIENNKLVFQGTVCLKRPSAASNPSNLLRYIPFIFRETVISPPKSDKPDKFFFDDFYCQRRFFLVKTAALRKNKAYRNQETLSKPPITGWKLKSKNNKDFNAEHIMPRSKIADKMEALKQSDANASLRLDDLYNLIPTDCNANNQRANLAFGEVKSKKDKVVLCGGSSLIGYSKSRKHAGEKLFQPPKRSRGWIARAMFYASIVYDIPIDEREEKILRNWNSTFLPTDREKVFHQRIFRLSLHRNPFIDYPGLVDLVEDF